MAGHKTTARKLWPRAEWIDGDGPWALVAYCRVTTVTLHATEEKAMAALEQIDRRGCGGACTKRHDVRRIG